MRVQYLFLSALLPLLVHAQQGYTDYIGAGHNKGIIVTTSSSEQRSDWHENASGDKTLSGDGLEGKKAEAARFLSQASFGYNEEDISKLADQGIEAWIDEQFAVAQSDYVAAANENLDYLLKYFLAQGVDSSDLNFTAGWINWRYAWWQHTVYSKDQLRQRMAFALSQILVISDTDLSSADELGGYYNLLSRHAFGNYKDLLLDVALNPSMGYYLSHLNNPREIPEENIHPDQNFAREIMQLFSIGLFELNMDGSKKLDNEGNAIPTYNNEHIAEMAKVFTGLGIGALYPNMGDTYFGRGTYGADMKLPMVMFEEWHQAGEKHLLNGFVVPDGQPGLKDIEDAVSMLFNHPNTAPFICSQLIQRLVKSNPSPAYIERVALVFADDGNGVRGNLKAVVKAILLDEEARSCAFQMDANSGKLIEPILRHTQFLKAIGIKNESDIYLNHAYNYGNRLQEHPLSAPSVFNFYRPDHSPTGPLNDAGLVAPEFQILNSLTVMDYPNIMEYWSYYGYPYDNWEDGPFSSYINLLRFVEPALDNEALINKIDLLFTHGNMSDATRKTITKAIQTIPYSLDGLNERIKMTLYLTLISPDYLIQK